MAIAHTLSAALTDGGTEATATWRLLQRQQILDIFCLLDLGVLGGTGIGCSVIAFSAPLARADPSGPPSETEAAHPDGGSAAARRE